MPQVDAAQGRVLRRGVGVGTGHGIHLATTKVYSGGNFQHLSQFLNELQAPQGAVICRLLVASVCLGVSHASVPLFLFC